MTTSAYRRVSNDEEFNNRRRGAPFRRTGSNVQPSNSSSSSSSPPTKTKAERVADKIHAFVWVVVASAVGWYTNLLPTLLTDDRVNRPAFHLALICLVVNSVLVFYLTVYLPAFRNVRSSAAWEIYCPRVIPTMTAFGLLFSVLFVRSTWEVWGFLSPLILGVESLGLLFSLHFVPWC